MKQLEINNIPEKEHLADGTTLIVKDMESIMHNSMMPYAEYVILDRALPRVEDGLKPGQRRILYAMYDMGVTPDKPYKKSASIVGECLGKYHPHGDRSVYDAMVRMAQSFNLNMPLVDGQGNFGSVDGDSAAAMRYTEAKLTELAMEMLKDIEKDTVKWSRNYDDTRLEPDILPGRFPNLLVNGASGIAVGLATNIPPHNLGEVIDGVVAYIDNKNIKLKDMMKIVSGPDFPTGGYVIAGTGLKQAYENGKGKILIRSKAHIETLSNDRTQIVITELPYQVNKSQLLIDILALRDEKKEMLAGITEIVDESDKEGTRAVIKLKKETDPKKILAILFKHTNLETSFGINMVAIADGKPQLMGLLDIIAYYTNYQRDVVLRRSKFELAEAEERRHIIEGLVIAVTNIDEVIRIIKTSNSTTDAKQQLRVRFDLSDRQAQAILDLRLARITRLEVDKLEKELADLNKLIDHLRIIVNSKKELMELVKTELITIKKAYKSSRKSVIIDSPEEAVVPSENDEVVVSEMVLALAVDGTIKSIPPKNFSMSNKDATERTSLGELHTKLLLTKTTSKLIFFSNLGNCYKTDCHRIPETKYRDKGIRLDALFPNAATPNEYAVNVFELPDDGTMPEGELLIYTRAGMVKRTAWSDYGLLKPCFQGFKGKEDDEVIGVELLRPDTTLLYVTRNGMCINFNTQEIPVQGRVAGGVKGMMLDEKTKDCVVFAKQIEEEGEIVIATNKCFVKRVIASEIPTMTRYRKGQKICELGGEKQNGSYVMFADYVLEPYNLVFLDAATTFVLNTEEIPIESRGHKGKPPKAKKKGMALTGAIHHLVVI